MPTIESLRFIKNTQIEFSIENYCLIDWYNSLAHCNLPT